MQDDQKAVWTIPYVFVAFFPSLKQNFIAYRSFSRPDCIFEIDQLWQSGFSRVYSNCGCSCSFKPEIIRIGQSSHKMYSNNILIFSRVYDNFKCLYQKILELYWRHHVYIYIYIVITPLEHWFPWLSSSVPFWLSHLPSLLDNIPFPHTTDKCKSLLVRQQKVLIILFLPKLRSYCNYSLLF